jgi:hypothetical protein
MITATAGSETAKFVFSEMLGFIILIYHEDTEAEITNKPAAVDGAAAIKIQRP